MQVNIAKIVCFMFVTFNHTHTQIEKKRTSWVNWSSNHKAIVFIPSFLQATAPRSTHGKMGHNMSFNNHMIIIILNLIPYVTQNLTIIKIHNMENEYAYGTHHPGFLPLKICVLFLSPPSPIPPHPNPPSLLKTRMENRSLGQLLVFWPISFSIL